MLNTERRQLPVVRIEKDYVLDTPDGKRSLLDLFDGRRQFDRLPLHVDPEDTVVTTSRRPQTLVELMGLELVILALPEGGPLP